MATKKKEPEKKPDDMDDDDDDGAAEASTTKEKKADPEPPDPNGQFSPSWLFQERERDRMLYRDDAQVFSYKEGEAAKHATFVGEISCANISLAEREVSRLPWGGPGQYVVWLLDRKSGQKVKGKYCYVKTSVDNRQAGADAGGVGFGGQGMTGQAGLVLAFAQALRPVQDPLTQTLMTRALDDKADMGVRLHKAFEEGMTAGIARGKALAGDMWKPQDVVSLVGQLRGLLGKGGAPAATGDVSVLDMFRVSLDHAISPAQAFAVLTLFRGSEVVGWLKANMENVIKGAQQDPEAKKLLERDGAQQWLFGFAGIVDQQKG